MFVFLLSIFINLNRTAAYKDKGEGGGGEWGGVTLAQIRQTKHEGG